MRIQSTISILFLGLLVAAPFAACMKTEYGCGSYGNCNADAGKTSVGGSEAGGSNEGGNSTGGTSGGESSTGGTTSIPCNGPCSGSTPFCNTLTNKCVECLNKTDCKDPLKPVCSPINVCVGCVTGADCSTDPLKLVCDGETSTCVGCLSSVNCGADPSKRVCNTSAKTCVSCLTNTDCPTANASRCDTGTNTCAACQVDADCSQVSGKTVCLTGVAGQPNQCVQCTPEKESACGANSCNPVTKECSSTPRGSVGKCQSCKADSECIGGDVAPQTARCIPLTYGATNEPRGGYCLRTTAVGCQNPYKVTVSAVSLSGAPTEDYCGINQLATTCEAVNDLIASKACTQAENTTECGAGKGGICKNFAAVTAPPDLRCTIPCISGAECLLYPAPGNLCNADAPYCH